MGLVKTRRLAYPPLVGVRDPWGSEHAERSECRAMNPPSQRLRRTGKQQRAKAAMKPPVKGGARNACSRQFGIMSGGGDLRRRCGDGQFLQK